MVEKVKCDFGKTPNRNSLQSRPHPCDQQLNTGGGRSRRRGSDTSRDKRFIVQGPPTCWQSSFHRPQVLIVPIGKLRRRSGARLLGSHVFRCPHSPPCLCPLSGVRSSHSETQTRSALSVRDRMSEVRTSHSYVICPPISPAKPRALRLPSDLSRSPLVRRLTRSPIDVPVESRRLTLSSRMKLLPLDPPLPLLGHICNRNVVCVFRVRMYTVTTLYRKVRFKYDLQFLLVPKRLWFCVKIGERTSFVFTDPRLGPYW